MLIPSNPVNAQIVIQGDQTMAKIACKRKAFSAPYLQAMIACMDSATISVIGKHSYHSDGTSKFKAASVCIQA